MTKETSKDRSALGVGIVLVFVMMFNLGYTWMAQRRMDERMDVAPRDVREEFRDFRAGWGEKFDNYEDDIEEVKALLQKINADQNKE